MNPSNEKDWFLFCGAALARGGRVFLFVRRRLACWRVCWGPLFLIFSCRRSRRCCNLFLTLLLAIRRLYCLPSNPPDDVLNIFIAARVLYGNQFRHARMLGFPRGRLGRPGAARRGQRVELFLRHSAFGLRCHWNSLCCHWASL